MRARPRSGRRPSFQFQLQRLSEASSNIHRDRLFKTFCPEWAASSLAACAHARIRGRARETPPLPSLQAFW
jgi:hypothetical protein